MTNRALPVSCAAASRLLLYTGLLAALAACGADARPRLVILYTPCTVNRDYLSPYNPRIRFTPRLEEFARKSVVFARHHTESGQSGISYASIYTGGQADHHQVYRHPVRLADDLYLAAEAYADAGYETYFWNAHGMAAPRLNYGQGVEPENIHVLRARRNRRSVWDPSADGRAAAPYLTASDPAFLGVLAKLRSNSDFRAFVMTNFTVTHGPYQGDKLERFREQYPEDAAGISDEEIAKYGRLYRKNFMGLNWNFPGTVERLKLTRPDIAKLADVVELLYKSNVNHLDAIFGEVVDQVRAHGLMEESLIVFTADHGEVLYRENVPFQWSHGMQLAPEVLRVPLIIRGADSGARAYEKVTRSIDVFPTIAGLSGLSIEPEHGIQGVDLSAAIRDEKEAPELLAFSHTTVLIRSVFERMQSPDSARDWARAKAFFPTEDPNLIWVSVVEGDRIYKWRNLDGRSWGMEVFDLSSDPTETRNLHDPEDPKHREMLAGLTKYKQRLVTSYLRDQDGEVDRFLPRVEEREALRALGYVD